MERTSVAKEAGSGTGAEPAGRTKEASRRHAGSCPPARLRQFGLRPLKKLPISPLLPKIAKIVASEPSVNFGDLWQSMPTLAIFDSTSRYPPRRLPRIVDAKIKG